MRSLTCDELADFHAAAYGPATIALAVVGDVEAGNVAALIEEELAEWVGAEAAVLTTDENRARFAGGADSDSGSTQHRRLSRPPRAASPG